MNVEKPSEPEAVPVMTRPRRHRRRKRKHKLGAAATENSATGQVKSKEQSATCSQKQKRKKKIKQVCLRPVDPPKAPENFTQFIIDDHENSLLFYDFAQTSNEYEEMDSQEADKDFWVRENEDFESLYQSVREENFNDFSRDDLIAKIREFEHKERNCREALVEKCPRTMLHRLQQQLIQLQEENKKLRTQRRKSFCGDSNCDTHQQADTSTESKEEEEETSSNQRDSTSQSDSEKENRPKSEHEKHSPHAE